MIGTLIKGTVAYLNYHVERMRPPPVMPPFTVKRCVCWHLDMDEDRRARIIRPVIHHDSCPYKRRDGAWA